MSFRDYAKAQVKKYEQDYIDKHSQANNNNNSSSSAATTNISSGVGGLITSK